MSLEVIKPGALSTFQDLGRSAHQHLGVPANGVMDERSHRLANVLVGNPASTATLEITLMGPTLKAHDGMIVALCGADLQAQVDGVPLTLNQPLALAPGAVLSFGQRRQGVRAYLAVRGGYALDATMGSCSTFVRGGYGGAHGRALRRGDLIAVHGGGAQPLRRRTVPPSHAFAPEVIASTDAPLRVMAGREWDAFSAAAQHALLHDAYRIGAQSERMGYRLEGTALELRAPREMRSEALGFGTIQVPPDGQPIVLMADRQTTGGYPRIAHVCAVDLPRLAQGMPGETVRFALIGLDEAQQLLLQQERDFDALAARLRL